MHSAARRHAAAALTLAAALAAVAVLHRTGERSTGPVLTGLRGKDVVIAFVAGYDRPLLTDPGLAGPVVPVLAADEEVLAEARFGSRSGFLEAAGWRPVRAELLEGGTDGSDRTTLPRDFRDGGWRTLAVQPGETPVLTGRDEFDAVWDSRTLRYDGPRFGASPMPDQYVLAVFQRDAYRSRTRPLAAAIALTSGRGAGPAEVPDMVEWNRAADSAAYPSRGAGATRPGDPVRTAADGDAVAYSLSMLTSWIGRHGDDDLVVVLVGDPSPRLLAADRSNDVPVAVITRDVALLDRVGAGWRWQPGLVPEERPSAFRVDAFRDELLRLFGTDLPGPPRDFSTDGVSA